LRCDGYEQSDYERLSDLRAANLPLGQETSRWVSVARVI
jgi:hypothetical protein